MKFDLSMEDFTIIQNAIHYYKHVEKLVLNNNSLTSLSGLETSWLHRTGPILLDLRNNFIREVSGVAKLYFKTVSYMTYDKRSLCSGPKIGNYV